MKPGGYFRFALLIPFILWVISLIVSLIYSAIELEEIWNIIFIPIVYYAIGILLWFFPYTVLAIGLWIWSKNRSSLALRNAALTAPSLFFLLILIEASWAYLSTDSISEVAKSLPEVATFLIVLSLVYGYLCVGIAFGIFKFLQAKNFIVQEAALAP